MSVPPGLVRADGLDSSAKKAGVGVDHDAAWPGKSSPGERLRHDLDVVSNVSQRLDSLRINPVIGKGLSLGGVYARRRLRSAM